jgi:hypothetical protein
MLLNGLPSLSEEIAFSILEKEGFPFSVDLNETKDK